MTFEKGYTPNIMDVPMGCVCVGHDNGVQYEIVSDKKERKPGMGTVTVRSAKRDDGSIAKFIRGIPVTILSLP